METTVVTAHIPKELSKRVDILADRLDRSKGWLIKQALENLVLDEEEKHRLTLEAMQDVREGKTVPHSVVKQWLREINAAR